MVGAVQAFHGPQAAAGWGYYRRLSGPGRKLHHEFLEIHPQLLRGHSSTYS